LESPLNASKTYGEKAMVMSGWGDQGSEREGGRGSEGEEREGAGAIERPPHQCRTSSVASVRDSGTMPAVRSLAKQAIDGWLRAMVRIVIAIVRRA